MSKHRRTVWEVLTKFDVSVRGMEQLGARTTGPLETCLAEVAQSDVYEVPNLGIIGASVMGTCGAHNHTLTAQALSWRTAEHLAKNWKTIGG
jgi:choline dehydrogenase-like flavoprotein